jgi:hypothetical protein
MWILPRPLHTSPYVPDTAALISDLNEQSQLCAQSLLLRSKPSPARTWLQKWKRDSWTRHLSGRILKPSHGPTFTTAWTSSVAATRASHSAPPVSVSVPTTPDTFGHTYQPELLQCDQVSVSLKTSKDISRWGCPTSSKTWQDWVTERRGAYSQRLKSAQSISANGSSSWPTTAARDYKGTSPNYSTRKDGKSRVDQLPVAVDLEERATWPTPTVQEAGKIGNQANHGQLALSNHPAIRGQVSRDKFDKGKHGPLVPDNSNTNGNRQELWPTPCANNPNEGETLESWDRRQALNKAKHNNGNGAGTPLSIKVKQWQTPKASDPQHSGPNMRDSAGNYALPAQAVREQWATPRANKTEGYSSPQFRPTLHQQTVQWASPHANCSTGAGQAPNKTGGENLQTQANGKLNPRWVETLMGLPVGWVMPSCASPVTIEPTNSDSSATESSPPPPNELFEFCLQS